MRETPNFPEGSANPRNLEVLRDDGLTQLLRDETTKGPAQRLLVKLRAGTPSPAKMVCLYNDHEILTRYALRCALPFERFEGAGQDARLLFRDPGGDPLDQLTDLSLEKWLKIAIRMVEALDDIHRAGLLHRDLRPSSFLLSGERVYVVDFSRAIPLRREHRDLQALDDDIQRLRYMSPELTGRLNRPVDYRADYYSLGVVLYQLFTGHLPFAIDDPHALVYQHLAMAPQSPREMSSEVPEALSCILLRLLEKDPDRRYQSRDELVKHLRLAREVLRGTLTDDAALVSASATQRPLDVPLRIYGRDDERQILLSCLERAFAHRPQLLLISGPSGIGKTALIRETYLPVTRQHAFFVSGKFDQLRRATPYSAWTNALEKLVEFVLAEPTDALMQWRIRLADALGAHAGVLSNMIPSLHTLLGEQPAPPELPLSEARERFHNTFLSFLGVFSQTERPLVVFLDDLQWIDSASLGLLETLVQRLDRLPLLVIGAYRDNEVTRTHPLMLTLHTLREQSRFTLSELALTSLESSHVAELLAEGMQRTPADVNSLAWAIRRKTGGNPFFIWQFLRTIRANGWLYIKVTGQRWEWDLEAIQQAGFADHVIDLMLHRFHTLPQESRQLLSWAACLGAGFDLHILSWLAGVAPAEVYRRLQPALGEEFILAMGEPEVLDDQVVIRRFRFFHDRMQEAAYHAIPETEIAHLHHRIADLLRDRLSEDECASRVMEIAGHLNLALSLITTAEENLELARLNLLAARKAKASAAFSAALEHLRLGMSQLPDDLWSSHTELAYQLYRERGELEYLNSEFETAERFVNLAIARVHDPYRRAELYHMLMVQYTLRARYDQAIDTARKALALFGEQLPDRNYEQARDSELVAVKNLLQGRPLDVLGELPAMQDPQQQAVMNLLITLGPPCYRARPRLWSVIVAREMHLCLKYGSVSGATYSYPAFGGLLTYVEEGDGKDCAALYRVTRKIMDQSADPADSSVGYLMMGSSLRHWFSPIKTASQDYLAAYRTGQASGNLQYAVYGFGHNTYCRYFQGTPLDELIPEALGYLDYSLQRRNLWGIDLITGALRVFQLLHGDWPNDDWPNKGESERAYLGRCEKHDNLQVVCIYHIMRANALLQLGDIEGAAHSLGEAEARLNSVSVQGLLPVTQFYALKALVLAETPELLNLPPVEAERYLGDTVKRYARWRQHAPDNFDQWYQLLAAEQARRNGDLETLVNAYETALQSARQQSCWPMVTLIAQRAERYWTHRGHMAFANVYRKQARRALQHESAWAVLAQRDQRAAGVASAQQEPQMDAVIHIAQALSLHTALDKLVPEIIHHVAQHTGAQRVALLLVQNDELRLAMESGVHGGRYYQDPLPLESVDTLPRSVIRYVTRAKRTLRFGHRDIGATLSLSNDPYLNGLVSGDAGFSGTVWCVPLNYLGQALGVLYLEHNLAADAFDERQAPLIEFLAAQAAISVRNIELIGKLAEEAEARREAELKMRNADTEIAMRREMEEQLKKLANTDELTRLPNRRMFIEHLEREWSGQRRRVRHPVVLMMLDIDYFKIVNDQYGHATGDKVLCHLAHLFRATLRASDMPARLGGEEFAVLLYDTDQAQALDIAERLCKRIEDTPARLDEHVISFTVSIGAVRMDAEDKSYESLLYRADQALYKAKADGRNRVCWEDTATH